MATERLATKGQMARILALYAQDKLSHEATQAFIRAHTSHPRVQRPTRADDPRSVEHWEERFPGKGAALLEILKPFFNWKPELKPALPDLEERAKSAVFWREIAGVRVFRSESDLFHAPLRVSLWVSFQAPLRDSLRISLLNSLRDSLPDSLPDLFRDSFRYSLLDSLRPSFGDSLFYPCGFVLAGKFETAAKFKLLHDLWLAGNFPAGFDNEGNLLVLVA
jgi:hypothetical protein